MCQRAQKNVVREIAEEGGLRAIIPIGKEVEEILSRERIQEAVELSPRTMLFYGATTPALHF